MRALPIIWNLKKCLRQPGIEPGTTAWKAAMLTITPLTLHAITDEVTSSLGIPVSTRSGIKLGNICGTLLIFALPIIWNLKKCLRQPRIEPRTTAWKAAMLTIAPSTLHV